MKIFFLENSEIEYDSNDRYENKIRGGESVLINLSEKMSSLGHEIHVFNKSKHNRKKINGVFWSNIDFLKNNSIKISCDVAIAQADANIFGLVKSKKNFLLSHSVQKFEKFFRKNQAFPFIKYRPKVIVASNYHYKTRSFLTSFYGKIKLFFSIDEIFSNCQLDNSLVEKKAIFTTRPDRNLDLLLEIWNKKIFPFSKESYLFINPPYTIKSTDKNVKLRTLGSQHNLLKDLKSSRVMLVPGHRGEIYCLAAREAAEMCIPIVTFGIGALSERVEHNKTGFIAKNTNEFAKYALMLLNEEKIWFEFRNNLLKKRNKISWMDAAKTLNNYLVNDK